MFASTEMNKRTSGDGMDNILLTANDVACKKLQSNVIYRPSQNILKSLQVIEPKAPIIKLIPKYIPKERKTTKYLIRKPKEPKFIPYEPYKGAVNPIVENKVAITPQFHKQKRNNIDIQDLVSHMSELRTTELKIEVIENDDTFIAKKQWEREKKAYEIDIKNLRETNAHLENQLKFQVQVNSELKTLLVAAVGEDLESRVQHLTEDKLQLARALLNSANHLTSHQEQTEWLSGQCEVWRSKFLASSLMVEELAKWKLALNNKVTEFQENIKKLFEERGRVRNSLMQTFSHLLNIYRYLNKSQDSVPLKSSNMLDLSSVTLSLSEVIANLLLKDYISDWKILDKSVANLPQNSEAELLCLQALRNPVTFPHKPDAICNALMGAAMSLGGGQLYLQHPSGRTTCCAHCTGEMQNI